DVATRAKIEADLLTVDADGNYTKGYFIKVRSNAKIEKLLETIDMPDLPHFSEVYQEAVNGIDKEIEESLKIIEATPELILFLSFVCGRVTSFHQFLAMPSEYIMRNSDPFVRETKETLIKRKGKGVLAHVESLDELCKSYD